MRYFIFFISIYFINSLTCGQSLIPYSGNSYFGGGFGLNWINGAPHYTFRMFPEFTISKVGIGLDLNINFTADGKIRSENFNEFSDYLSLIRYVRYGQKNDPLYIRLGALDYTTLGHGSIVYLYNNSPSLDSKKIGLAFDADFNEYGFELVYSNFGSGGLIGGRFYVRPLKYTNLARLLVVGSLEIGATLVTDTDDNAGVTSGKFIDSFFVANQKESNTTVVGFDVGLPILRTEIADLDFYVDHSKIINFGSGTSIGMIFGFKGFSIVKLFARIEKRFIGKEFIPSYFNSLYEIEKFALDYGKKTFSSKLNVLKQVKAGSGYFGELSGDWFGILKISGSFSKTVGVNDGILHLQVIFDSEQFPYTFRAGYDKCGIEKFTDLFGTDEHSFAFAEAGYKFRKYFLFSLFYSWTFEPVRNNLNEIMGYKPQRRIEPRISFIYPISN
ncbi:hypothetical protein [Melioribacter sp. OK-6-Me]|uniref:hypothetical protein n=1 Tax=unclassified Melioribacter TaxID=2627329 RepID=UPI003EDA4613